MDFKDFQYIAFFGFTNRDGFTSPFQFGYVYFFFLPNFSGWSFQYSIEYKWLKHAALFCSSSHWMLLWCLSLLTTTHFLKFSACQASSFPFSRAIATSETTAKSPSSHPLPSLPTPKQWYSLKNLCFLFTIHSAAYLLPGKYLLLLSPDNP